MPGADPDYGVLTGFIRNRLAEGMIARFSLQGRMVFIAKSDAWGDTVPSLLVVGEQGESRLLTPDTPLNMATFVAGGFTLQRAVALAKVFRALNGTHNHHKRVRKHNGATTCYPAT